GRALGDERLGRVERIHRELHPAAIAHEMLLEEHVVDVVPRVTLVAGKVDGTLDVDGKVRVDLDEAAEITLVPVVGAPAPAGDVLHGEGFTVGELDVLQRAAAAAVDGRAEHVVEPFAGNDELL